MAMRWPAIAALCAALTLAACATTGLYQARDGESGYAETRLDQTQWRVEFVGDDFTARETVETYLLYRAAELTAANGFDWFATVAQRALFGIGRHHDGTRLRFMFATSSFRTFATVRRALPGLAISSSPANLTAWTAWKRSS